MRGDKPMLMTRKQLQELYASPRYVRLKAAADKYGEAVAPHLCRNGERASFKPILEPLFSKYHPSDVPEEKDQLIGHTFHGRYRIIGRLGSGGLSFVYLARDHAKGGRKV